MCFLFIDFVTTTRLSLRKAPQKYFLTVVRNNGNSAVTQGLSPFPSSPRWGTTHDQPLALYFSLFALVFFSYFLEFAKAILSFLTTLTP